MMDQALRLVVSDQSNRRDNGMKIGGGRHHHLQFYSLLTLRRPRQDRKEHRGGRQQQ